MKHTKGNWEVDSIQDENFVYCDGHLICTPCTLLPDEEIEANARLMAKSPVMYDLLDQIHSALKDKSELTIIEQSWFKAIDELKIELKTK